MAFSQGTAQLIGFTTLLASDGKTPTAPENPVATLSKDGAAFVAATNAVTSIGGGACTILLTDAETAYGLVKLRVTSDNCDQIDLDIYFEGEYTAALADQLEQEVGGLGDFSVTLTVEDDSGDPVAGARLTVAGLAPRSSEADGSFGGDWGLSANTYVVTILTGAGYLPDNPYSLVVAADGSVTTPTGGAFVVPKLALPVASDPDNTVLYLDMTNARGAAVGAGDIKVSVDWVDDAGLTDADALVARRVMEDEAETPTDATGRWELELPTAWFTDARSLNLRLTDTTGSVEKDEFWRAELVAPEEGETSVSWAACTDVRRSNSMKPTL